MDDTVVNQADDVEQMPISRTQSDNLDQELLLLNPTADAEEELKSTAQVDEVVEESDLPNQADVADRELNQADVVDRELNPTDEAVGSKRKLTLADRFHGVGRKPDWEKTMLKGHIKPSPRCQCHKSRNCPDHFDDRAHDHRNYAPDPKVKGEKHEFDCG